MTLVIDASMALSWIFARTDLAEADCSERALTAVLGNTVIAPALWNTEVANALLVGERRKVVSEAQVLDFLARLDRLPIGIDEAMPMTRRDQVMALAREHSLTAYDATYLDLALRHGAVLATFDRKLAAAMLRAGGTVFQA